MLVWAVVLLATVVLLVLGIRWLEPRMIYYPAPYPLGVWDPEELGVDAEDVEFRTADGLVLHAWWVPAASTGAGTSDAPSLPEGAGGTGPPVLLWCHGNAGNLTIRGPHAQRLAELGLSVLLFDYRGYGRSEGSPDEAGLYADAEAAYRYLVEERGIRARRIVLLGRSLGAAPAARLATRHPHAGLLLVSPFPSAAAMARTILPLPLGPLLRSRFPVEEWVAERTTPLLVIHGERDGIVPVAMGRRVLAAASEPKELLLLPRAGHNDVLEAGGRRYLEGVREFAYRATGQAGDARNGENGAAESGSDGGG